ncbi:MAG: hypothetical protein ACE5E7_17375 [Anaerolineae bacterium]
MAVILAQVIGSGAVATILLSIADQLGTGALDGVLVGALVGALALPMSRAPDTMGRGLFLAIMLGLLVGLFELARIGVIAGQTMGSMIDAFMGEQSTLVAALIRQAGIRVLIALFLGAILGMGSKVPDMVIKGSLWGFFVGAAIGALLRVALVQFGAAYLSLLIFRVIVGMLSWGLIAAVGSK